jgi:hypothetical protein
MSRKPAVRKEMQKVCRRFDRWRKTRVGRSPIPERLWRAAVESANEHGICRTAQVLHLDYYKLRRLVGSAGRTEQASPRGADRSLFVELAASPVATGTLDCSIELEGPRGRLRVQWRGNTSPDLAGLSRCLWEAA